MSDDKKTLDKSMEGLKDGMTPRKAIKVVLAGATALLVIFIVFMLMIFAMFS